ncbi:hypothetical protein MYX06_03495 [Patescibacteria group bacterium AH-259-L05]|nr:hypothetical protein [Patescibacteria group bacterium AH-259-L05]
MKYVEFQNQFKNYILISLADVKNIDPHFDQRRLYEWQKKGYITKATNSYYVFADKKLSEHDLNFIANKIYEPSYLSLEYALQYYSLIPEAVFLRTSVTPRKTRQIRTPLGNFLYQTVKNSLFFGYTLETIDNITFKIAEPEKALLDFLYLRKDITKEDDFYELRLNSEIYKEIIDKKKLSTYRKRFKSKTLSRKVRILANSINEQ